MVRVHVKVALHGGGPEELWMLRRAIVQIIEALKDTTIPVTVEIEHHEDESH